MRVCVLPDKISRHVTVETRREGSGNRVLEHCFDCSGDNCPGSSEGSSTTCGEGHHGAAPHRRRGVHGRAYEKSVPWIKGPRETRSRDAQQGTSGPH